MLKNEDIQLVRQSVTMRQIAQMYGYKVTRTGYISCPFHGEDRHPSMKLYDGEGGYYCFVCHKAGDAIRFVRDHDNLDFEPAVRMIANYFAVPISDGKNELSKADRERIRQQRAEREAEARRKEARNQRMIAISERIHILESIKDRCEPLSYVWCGAEENITKLSVEWEHLFKSQEY